MTGPALVSVPLEVRVAVAHAAVQHVAERLGIDVLHIKGPAFDPDLLYPFRRGTDADVLLRPDDAVTLVHELSAAGWELSGRFETSSAFRHSATLRHHLWGYVDVHRYFPGITLAPDAAFDLLWQDRHSREIAGVACSVPSREAQLLVAILHAARSGRSPRAKQDVDAAWHEAGPRLREQVLRLRDALGAQLAFAAATGHLDEYRDAREHDLWAVASSGGTRLQEWRARVKAAPTRREALGVILRAPLVNVDHLAMALQRRPTRAEVVAEFFARPVRGVAEAVGWRGMASRRARP